MKWLELTVYTTDAGIDSVCAALNGAGITGLSIEESHEKAYAFLKEAAIFWDFADMDKIGTDTPCVKGYVADCPENLPTVEAAKAAIERLRTLDLPVDLGTLLMTVVSVDEEDWANNWKKYYKPLEIGSRLLVLPSWEDRPQTDRIVLKLDPGMAFGTGAHHTTRMCLEFLEKTVKAGDTMLDLGCGSGILSIASRLLGATEATAVDIDPIAESIAYEKWPTYDEKAITLTTVKLAVSVNGKMRDVIEVSKEATQDEVMAKANESAKVQSFLAGHEIKKIIYVPGRILNIVVA